jgi:hypothetical protein
MIGSQPPPAGLGASLHFAKRKTMRLHRQPFEEVSVRKYHHLGIPTDVSRKGENYFEQFKMYTSGFDTSPYGVEWLRFEPDCPLPELVKTVPHVAFVVDDIDAAIAGKDILIQPNNPSPGVTVAFIVHDGAPIEFLQFSGPDYEVWPGSAADGV